MIIKNILTTSLLLSIYGSAQAIDIILINDEENGATSWAARKDHRTKVIKRYDNARLVCSIGRNNQISITVKDIFLRKGKGTLTNDTLPWTQDFDTLDPLRLVIKLVINEKGISFPQYLTHEILNTSTYGPNDKITVRFKGIEKGTRFESFNYVMTHDSDDSFVSEIDGLRETKVRPVDTVREADRKNEFDTVSEVDRNNEADTDREVDTVLLNSASDEVPPPTDGSDEVQPPTAELGTLSLNDGASPRGNEITED